MDGPKYVLLTEGKLNITHEVNRWHRNVPGAVTPP